MSKQSNSSPHGWAWPTIFDSISVDEQSCYCYLRVAQQGVAVLAVRLTGPKNSASFYGLVLNAVSQGVSKLMKFTNVNLDSNTPIIGTALTGSNISTPTGLYYRIRAVGSTIEVHSSPDESTWTLLASATDTTIPAGRPGLVYLGNNTSQVTIDRYRARLMSIGSLFQVRVNVLYSLIGEQGKIAMGTVI
jgi:hypothetical protein